MGALRRSSFPGPCICRLVSFSFVIWPSVWPFDRCAVIAFWTAPLWRRTPLSKISPRQWAAIQTKLRIVRCDSILRPAHGKSAAGSDDDRVAGITHLILQGGISPSKAYAIVKRFSEDIDQMHDIRALVPASRIRFPLIPVQERTASPASSMSDQWPDFWKVERWRAATPPWRGPSDASSRRNII